MRLRNLLFLYVRRVRTHPFQELLALVGIAVGVALVFAVQVANTSVSGSVRQLAEAITGDATLQVASRTSQGFDGRLVRTIAQTPGVEAAAPLVDVRVNLRSRAPDGEQRAVQLIGGDERLGALGVRLGALGTPYLHLHDALALPAPTAAALGVAAGERVRLQAGARVRAVPVAAVLSAAQLGPLVDSPLALASLSDAQRLLGMQGRVTRVLVAAAPGRADEVRARLDRLLGDRLSVAAHDAEARLLQRAAAPNDQSTALFAAISALVGLLFALNAMMLTVPERRRFIADLRLEGFGDWTIVKLVLFDALLLGLAASALGLLLGDQLSRHVFEASPGYLSFAFAVGDQRIIEPVAVGLAVAGGVGVTLLAALRPLTDLLSRRPLDAPLREDDVASGRLAGLAWLAALGLAFAAGAGAVLLLAPGATLAGIGLLVASMLALLPALLALALAAIDLVSRRLRAPVLVVSLGELRGSATRSLALAATGALAVFGSVAVEGAHFDLQRGLDRDARQINAQADLWVVPAGEENVLATMPFGGAPPALDDVPGVAGVRPYRGVFLDVGDRRMWVVAPPPQSRAPILPSQLVDGDLATANARIRGGGWVALSQAVAQERGLALGDVVTLPAPRPTPLRLAATLTNLGWTSGAAVLNARDFRRALASSDVTALQVRLAPGASHARTAAAIGAALGPGSGLAVETAAEREARFRAGTRQGLDRLTQIATLVLLAAALALATAMTGVVWSRRPRLAALKLSGFSDGDTWRALVLESTLVLGVGCSVGALFGLCGQYMLTRWLAETTGFPTEYATAGTFAAATFAGVTLVAVAIAALPGWAAARVSPSLATADE